MKKFQTPSTYLETPDDWKDLSTLVLSGPPLNGVSPTIVVTHTLEIPERSLDAHVEQQLIDLGILEDFQLLDRRSFFDTPGDPRVVLDFSWREPERGAILHQRQTYVLVPPGVYTLTATADAEHFDTVATLFDDVVGSFRPQEWTAEDSGQR